MTTPLILVPPQAVTDSMLAACDVPENDYPAWSSGTAYAIGDRVIRTSTHRVYEAAQAGTNHTPESSPTYWIEVGPTNRWRLFDTSNSTQTAQASSMSYTITLAAGINALGLLNLTGATSVRVRLTHPSYGTVYDRTNSLASTPMSGGWWQWFFGSRRSPALAVWTDLPGILGCTLIVDITGTSSLAVGVLLFGQQQPIGIGVLQGAKVGIQDYSRVETNDFGDTVLVQRAFAKRATFDVPVLSEKVDSTHELLTTYRATPCLWIGTTRYASSVLFGFYKNFDLVIAYDRVSDCSIDLQGLT